MRGPGWPAGMDCQHQGMDREMAAIPCPSCRASSAPADLSQTHWSCPACRRSWFLRRCSACAMVSQVSALQGWHQRWDCVWCQAANAGFTQNRDPAAATVGDLAVDVAAYGLRLGPEEADEITQPFADLPLASPPRPGTGPGTRRRRRPGRRVAVLAVIVLAIATLTVALGRLGHGAGPDPAAMAGSPPGSRAVAVTATSVGTVDLRGVPGLLTVVGTSGGPVRLTGVLHWTGPAAPVGTRRLGHGVLNLSYRCGRASPCTEDYRLAVPGQTAAVIRQPSGHVLVSGLAGSLSILATSADVSATGLRSPALWAQISSGHLAASFAVPPRRVSVTLTSAQATVVLPAVVGYLVSSQVRSGSVNVDVPRTASSARTVTARIDQGELQLLPS